MNHEVPEMPWSRLAMNLFSFEAHNYLLMVDYFSVFWEIDKLNTILAAAIITVCKHHHSLQASIYMTWNSYNNSHRQPLAIWQCRISKFAQDWGRIPAKLPYNSHLNGKAEVGDGQDHKKI